jgi:hypothetical protein
MKNLFVTSAATLLFGVALSSTSFAANGVCQRTKLKQTGSVELMQISDSGVQASLSCDMVLHSYLTSPSALRGRTNYTNEEDLTREEERSRVVPIAQNGMLSFYAGEPNFNYEPYLTQQHRSTFFALPLADHKTLQLVLETNGQNLLVSSYVVDNNLGSETLIASWKRTTAARDSMYGVHLVANQGVLKTLVVNLRSELRFDINLPLTKNGLMAWQYGMLEDPSADNILPVRALLGDGPKPLLFVPSLPLE